jgi:hypothetical protein
MVWLGPRVKETCIFQSLKSGMRSQLIAILAKKTSSNCKVLHGRFSHLFPYKKQKKKKESEIN